jgi:short-subunit dehydrogenase
MRRERIAREVIVVTGASGGIGRATALAFARPGARIALLARGERGLAGAQREVEEAGAEALVIRTDVADAEQVERAAAQIEARWGAIDVWVNNAMATVFAPIADLSAEDLRRTTEVTYLGAAYGTMAALKRMRVRNRGVIVQVGSALAYRAIPLQAAYCAAKHALLGFTNSLRSELLHERSRVHVTMVHLSAFNTPQFDWSRNLVGMRAQPVPPIFQPELAAKAIVWAARHRRREVYVGWPAVKAVAANKIAPGVLDRILARAGYDGQITSEPLAQDACDNLYAPCDVDPGARGRFDAIARDRSWQWEVTKHRSAIAVGAIALLGAWALARGPRRRARADFPSIPMHRDHVHAPERRAARERYGR